MTRPKQFGKGKASSKSSAKKNEKQTLPFLDIPAELRIKIYRSLLKFDQPIELWPETGRPGGNDYVREANGRSLGRQFKDHGKCILGILRTCRVVNEEAAEVFYGENEWRFSGVNGWMVTDAFLYTIGQRHFKHIKSLTLPVPFWSFRQTRFGRHGCAESLTNTRDLDHATRLLQKPRWDQWDYLESFKAVCLVMGKVGKLRSLDLVLPQKLVMDLERDGEEVSNCLDDLTVKLPQLKVSVIRLCKRNAPEVGLYPPIHWTLLWNVNLRKQEGIIWDVKFAFFHPKGWYKVIDDPGWFPEEFYEAMGTAGTGLSTCGRSFGLGRGY